MTSTQRLPVELAASIHPSDPTRTANHASAVTAFPTVQGRCPACGGTSLFLGSGGYVTCSRIDCPDPSAASDLLEHTHREEEQR